MITQTHRRALLVGCLVAASSAISFGESSAETWLVAKDGSGHYSVIQDAVDAAAPGDTVRIGPGHYSEYRDFQLDCCLTMPTYVGISVEDLTIIGAHRDSVTIGPEVSTGQESIVGMRLGASAGFVVEDLTVQQGTYGLVVADSARVRNVRFKDCWIGSFTFPDEGALFEGCVFLRCTNSGIAAGMGSRNVTVDSCMFVDNASGVNFTASEDPVLLNSVFLGTGTTRIVVSGAGSRLTVSGCHIEGGVNSAVAVLNGAELQLNDTQVTTTGRVAIWTSGASTIDARRNVFDGGWYSTCVLRSQRMPITFVHNSILRGSGYSVVLDSYPARFDDVVLSLQKNFWGTTEIDSVRAWILDGDDDPSIRARVKVEPILPTSPIGVGSTERSIGGLKSLFGN